MAYSINLLTCINILIIDNKSKSNFLELIIIGGNLFNNLLKLVATI